MDELKTMGLVIHEVQLKEADKLLTILTPEHGKILVSGKGVSSLRSKHMTSAQLFSYSNFVLRKSRKYFYINDSDMEECFFNIRYDVEKLALATYFCDVANDLALEDVGDPELLRLMLNTLYALANKKSLNMEQIRAAFEFRATVGAGFSPMLDECGVCGGELNSDALVFDVMNGCIRCPKCFAIAKKDTLDPDGTADITYNITSSTLAALRYIATAPVTKFLSFSLPEKEREILSGFAETYHISHLEHNFSSLKYYKKIKMYGINYE